MSDVDRLSCVVQGQFGKNSSLWITPGEYESIDLALLDSIYSTGNRYSTVLSFVNRYRELRSAEAPMGSLGTIQGLIGAFDHWGGVEGFVVNTKCRLRTYSRKDAPYKAEAAYRAALVLEELKVDTKNDLRCLEVASDTFKADLSRAWKSLPSQSSGLTLHYFLMLQGIPGVKADRMVMRYVNSALGFNVSSVEAANLVRNVAESMDVSATHLDHVIWRAASGRPWRVGESQ